jgi:phosphoribosylanthranilate isomerase
VGLFVNPERSEVETILSQVPLDLLQFHGDETPEFCAQFARPFIKAVQVRAGLDLLQYCDKYREGRAILLDAYHPDVRGGSGASFDWSLIPKDLPLPVILSGGLDSENVREAIQRVAPYAVDVSSGVEAAKGIKDPLRIESFVNGVR